MRLWIALALLSSGLLFGHPAWSASAKPKALERAARKACLSGDYVKGVSILADLFVDTNNPNYLFNQARCYEQNLRFVEAAERFKEYLRKAPNLGDKEKTDVEKHIADCESAASTKSGASDSGTKTTGLQPPAATAPTESAVEPATNTPALPAVGVSEPVPNTPSAPEQRSWKRTAKWIAAGAAVGFATFGGIEHYRYYSKNKEFNDAVCRPGECKGLSDSADTAQVMAIVGYSVAGAAAVGAIIFWLTDSPPSQPAAQAGIGFSCIPAPTGLTCHGRF
jgi:tetratricopeptide (TPR) repeat protein